MARTPSFLKSQILLMSALLIAGSACCNTDAFADSVNKAKKTAVVWKASDGWNGIVVGKHTLHDAESILGKVQNVEDLSGEKAYNFRDAAISLTLDPKTKLISMIRVSGDLKDRKLMPSSILEAEKKYGPLRKKSYNKASGNTYGKPGLTVQADTSASPEKIVWMEFSKP
ncbi:MAG: hypothetical protein IAF58_01265 [Leptolyngbya sp.]|nr:hypothetical protein [Candidatus Melainabacteria bacterium]